MDNRSIEKTADQEKDSPAVQLKKMQKSSGLRMFTPERSVFRVSREYNYYTICFKIGSALLQGNHIEEGIIAFAKATEKVFRHKLKANGFVIGDRKLPLDDPRVIRLRMKKKEIALRNRPG